MPEVITNLDIYRCALRLLAESGPEAGESTDYAERAEYLLAAFCSDVAELHEAYREHFHKETPPPECAVSLPLEAPFPLLARFRGAAAYYLASMLILDEDCELSDRLYDRYASMLVRIQQSIPGEASPIKDLYGF